MNDYISRKKAIGNIERLMAMYGEDEKRVLHWFRAFLLSVPAVDVVERKKGKWLYHPKGARKYECPYCRTYSQEAWCFCPNCGADMRGEEE